MILAGGTSKLGNALNSMANALGTLITFCMVACLGTQGILAQQVTTQAIEKVVPAVFTGDVRSLPKGPASQPPPAVGGVPEIAKEVLPGQKTFTGDESIIRTAPAPATSVNFPGLKRTDAASGGLFVPSDVNGDVGRNHYIQSVNSGYAIYSKAGALLASFTENGLFTPLGGDCSTKASGDPIVLYDVLRDRWILTHLAFSRDAGNNPTGPFFQCIAASRTSDPVAGGWNLYAVQTDTGVNGLPGANVFGDYPKFGVWTDCLYMSANTFQFPGGTNAGTLFASLSKDDMYAGLPLTAAFGTFPFSAANPFTMLPSHFSGNSSSAIPPAGTPNYYVSQSLSLASFEVRKFTPGANCGAGGSMSAKVDVGHTAYGAFPGANVVPQLGTATLLGIVGDRMMQRAQYRKVGAAESVWVSHNAYTTPISTQWAQIDVTGGTVAATPVQQQIYSPDSTLHRWMGSIAADSQGNAALGYSTSASTAFPSIAYAGRLIGDPLNQLPQTETQLVAGAGSQVTANRWGDYTGMVVDPCKYSSTAQEIWVEGCIVNFVLMYVATC